MSRTLCSMVMASLLLTSTSTITVKAEKIENTVETNGQGVEDTLINIKSLDDQLDELYSKIGEHLGVDKSIIKQIHALCGSKAVYADKKPSIYNDLTTYKSMDIYRGKCEQGILQKADFIECGDDNIDRPSEYFLPDALYSVSYDIVSLMSQRFNCDRGPMQEYFDNLKEDVKQRIVFYEAVMEYTGCKESTVDEIFKAYEKCLYDKQKDENVIETNKDGQLEIKSKFRRVFNDIGIKNETRLNYLAIILSYDKDLAVNDNAESTKDEYIVPYKLNYTSRENMMLAAACLVGKVRYVWAGGHSGASYIDGINPAWEMWSDLYTGDNYEKCIQPHGSWCPEHGYSSGECTQGGIIRSLDDYISKRSKTFRTDELDQDKYRKLLAKVDYSNGISTHTLDGLDCSGFASWLYNQITDKYNINSTARCFTKQGGIKEVAFGSKMLPGDVFSWTSHIVVIVGQVRKGSKAYVTVEETPHVLKYGVVYYAGASSADIEYGKKIASEANTLIGGIPSGKETPHVYCMNNVGHYTEEVEVDEEKEKGTKKKGSKGAKKKKTDVSVVDNELSLLTSAIESIETTETNTEDSTEQETEEIGTEDKEKENDAEKSEDNTEDNKGNSSSDKKSDKVNKEKDKAKESKGTKKDKKSKKKKRKNKDNKKKTKKVKVNKQYISIGRFEGTFIDEKLGHESFEDLTALEIIRHTIKKLPMSYVSGYNIYKGKLFDKKTVASELGVKVNE